MTVVTGTFNREQCKRGWSLDIDEHRKVQVFVDEAGSYLIGFRNGEAVQSVSLTRDAIEGLWVLLGDAANWKPAL